ncbi:MAG TPA: tetratricopeptide repeat protein [Syntrophales bacterium]|nr:tetratricopeptide repeat protein [Syntrophales bacterium]
MANKLNNLTLLLFMSVCALWILPATPVPAASARIWTVQIAAFTERENMNKAIAELEKKGVRNVWVQKEGAAYATRAGKYARKKDGAAALAKIRKTYPQAVLKPVTEDPARIVYGRKTVGADKQGDARRQDVGGQIPEKAVKVAPPGTRIQEGKAATPPAKVADPQIAAADKHYERGEYQAAAALLQELMRQKAGEPEVYEQAIRKLADCLFSIGRNGANPYLFSAVDHYKYILRYYADPRPGNDIVYDHLARSYEALKFYYEAAGAWQALLAKYPDSSLGEDALFHLAEVAVKVGRHEQAIENYRQYLNKYPQGAHVRTAVLHLADSYYQKKDYDNAALLYENAGKDYKEITEIPKEYLYRIGDAAYRKGKYGETIRILSVALSVYPQDEQARKSLYLMGCALQQSDRLPTAIRIFDDIIANYPDSDESRESILKIAMLGGQGKGLRVPVYLTAATYFQDPLKAYDMLLAARPEQDLEERVRFAKAETLAHQGRYAEAVDEYLRLAEKYPQGRYVTILPGQLKAVVWKLTEILHARGDHVGLAALYCKTFGRIGMDRNDLAGLTKMADSLHKISLDEEAIRVWKYAQQLTPEQNLQNPIGKALENINTTRNPGSLPPGAERPASADGVSGESLESLEKYLAAAGGSEQRRWLLFEIGRRLSKDKERTAAEKRFLQIKEGNPDPFWTKLSDYAVREARWTERYRDLY